MIGQLTLTCDETATQYTGGATLDSNTLYYNTHNEDANINQDGVFPGKYFG